MAECGRDGAGSAGPGRRGGCGRCRLRRVRTAGYTSSRALPRVIEEWDGSRWATVGLVDGLVAAMVLLYASRPVAAKPAKWARPALGKGRGHRRPNPRDGVGASSGVTPRTAVHYGLRCVGARERPAARRKTPRTLSPQHDALKRGAAGGPVWPAITLPT
nr:DUF6087 family protein [Streptomyces subrutilus]